MPLDDIPELLKVALLPSTKSEWYNFFLIFAFYTPYVSSHLIMIYILIFIQYALNVLSQS